MITPENIRETTIKDIKKLLESNTPEDFEIEYKRELTSDKKELKADVIQFANTYGGILIIGIEEEDRVAKNIVPITGDIDAVKLQINQTLRSNIEPAIQGLVVQEVEVVDGFIILIGIPESKNKPHCYVRDEARRFYGRNSSGKFEMDLPHIRDSFLKTHHATIAMDRFRDLRVSQIASNEIPIQMESKPENQGKLILQIFPHSAFGSASNNTFTLSSIARLPTLARNDVPTIHNVNGVLSVPNSRLEYTQVYRNGTIEAVGAGVASPYKYWSGYDGSEKYLKIPAQREAIRIIYKTKDFLQCLLNIGVEGPFRIYLSLLDVKGVRVATDEDTSRVEDNRSSLLYKSNFVFPPVDIMISDLTYQSVMEAIRPLLDILWNADGKPFCDLVSRWRENDKWLLNDIRNFNHS